MKRQHHYIKILPVYYNAIDSGEKSFEVSLKSATNSHADYYCCQDTLFDDSLATSDVIIYE